MDSLLIDRVTVPGVRSGTLVPIEVDTFRRAYRTFVDALDSDPPRDPDFPTHIQDAATGEPAILEDTPFNRAWIAAARLFDDDGERISFQARVERVLPLIEDRKYARYFDRRTGTLHVAMVAAICSVPFSYRTRSKALRATFDLSFRAALAAIESHEARSPQRH